MQPILISIAAGSLIDNITLSATERVSHTLVILAVPDPSGDCRFHWRDSYWKVNVAQVERIFIEPKL